MRRWLPRPNLLVAFGLASLLPIVGLGLVLARDLRANADRQALYDARRLAVDVANLRIAPNVDRADLRSDRIPPYRARRLNAELAGALESSEVARAKLWAPDGRVVFSDDRALAGRHFPVSHELREALGGEVAAELTTLESAEQARDRALGKAVEVYVPLRFEGSAKVVGAFELYVPYAAVSARVKEQANHTFLLLLAGLTVLWAALFPIVFWVSRRLRRQSRENRYQATHDLLTGLPNRQAFAEHVDATAAQSDGAVAVLDLDRFREINEGLGHAAGDALLAQVGPRLAGALDPDVTVARLAGDEFALLLAGSDGQLEARSALEALEHLFTVEGLQVHVEGSVGIARYPEHGSSAQQLLRRADVALAEARRTGAAVVTYDAAIDPAGADRLGLLGQLREAIESNQLVLHYQPKLDVASRRVVGFEALVRWQHPERGLLAPGEFVPAAEHTALIRPLTLWVLERAMVQCKRWRAAGHELTMAVNLSAANLMDLSLPTDVARLLAQTRLPPCALELEITESVAMVDPGRAAEVLALLRSMGITLAIDDFGTGQASLAYLQRLPVGELKIDRTFVAALGGSARDEAIVHSTIEMAHGLGLSVVAEGVENEAVFVALGRLGCDTAQGFHLGRPVPAEAVVLPRLAPVLEPAHAATT
jgi:diguanylate cyclase (GGDEF)-like protein